MKVKKTKSELWSDLAEQIELLCAYCEAFDQGKWSMAKPISVSLQLLLAGDTGRSLALLHQLAIRHVRFVDTAPKFADQATFAKCQLAGIHISSAVQKAAYVPLLSAVPHPILKTHFSEWWTRSVVRDTKSRSFSRLELVREVRNTDGGGHLDPELKKPYADFRSGEFMGWRLKRGNSLMPIGHPHLACMRQIAHETLLTLEEVAAQAFKGTRYTYPVDPAAGLDGVLIFDTDVTGAPGKLVPVLRIGETELVGEV